MSFLGELQRRNVLKVAAAYIVVAWVVIEAAATLREIFDAPLWIVQSLTVLLALGLIPVLVFSWFYELTPQGIVRDDQLGDDRRFAEATGRKLIYITIAFVVVGVALIAWTRSTFAPEEPLQQAAIEAEVQGADPLSVAVLPFRNMSANEENEYFADGLTETLLHMLAQVDDLTVMARTSSFAFKRRDMDIREIAAALGVANVLEGSVQREGDRVRVTAQLIRADDGSHLWSKNYDRTLTDVFSIQDDLAAEVGITLLSSLLSPADFVRPHGVDTDNFAAYDLYLQARSERHKGSFQSLRDAETLLLAALEEDAGYDDARVEHASLLLEMADTGLLTFDVGLERMASILGDVLLEDPTNSKAHILQLLQRSIRLQLSGEFDQIPGLLREARDVYASVRQEVSTSVDFAQMLIVYGELQLARAVLENALEIDPLNPKLHAHTGSVNARLGNHAAAKDAYQRSVELEPEAPNTWIALGSEGLHTGDGTLVIESFQRAAELDPLDPEMAGAVAETLYELGLIEEAGRYHERVIQMAPDSDEVESLEILEAVARGDIDNALRLSRESLQGGRGTRGSAWHAAWRVVFHTSAQRGTEAEDIALYDQAFPGFADTKTIEVPGAINVVRVNVLDVFLATTSLSDLEQMATGIFEHYRNLGTRRTDFPLVHLDVLILFHPMDEAVKWALDEVFSKPPSAFYGQWMWRLRFSRPFMAPFFEDPRIREALARWEEEEARMRTEVRAWLASQTR